MKFTFFSFLLTLFLTPAAHAGRALVFMKDRTAFESARLPVKIQKDLKNLNTFIVETQNESELQALKNLPGVSYVEKEHTVPVAFKPLRTSRLANVAVERPGRTWGLTAIKAPQAWEKAGKGRGIRVLVLDTGIDAKHPSLKANFEKGRDFTGISKGEDFTDQTGHGTHVAGTVAAVENADGFAGVAPQAKILAGRVCSEMGCSNVGMVEGIDWGVSEKVDVINMSLGSMGPPSPAEQAAILRADRAGIAVVAATGNYGIDKVLFPAAHPSVIAVGAVDQNMQSASFSQYGPEVSVVAPGVEVVSTYPMNKGRKSTLTLNAGNQQTQTSIELLHGTTPSWQAETLPVVDCGLGRPEDFTGRDLNGKIALVAKTEMSFADQIRSAMRAGARQVLVHNVDDKYTDTRLFERENTLFASAYVIDRALGLQLKALLAQHKNPLVAVQTIATHYFETFGTSMASPHVAGVVALVRAANKDLTPAQIKALVMKTALPLTPNPENKFGAGLVDAEAAVIEAQRFLK